MPNVSMKILCVCARVCVRIGVLVHQEEPVALEKPAPRESASLGHTAYSLAATAYTQDQLYINGGLNYSYRGYNALGTSSMPQPVSLTTGAAQSNGKECSVVIDGSISGSYYSTGKRTPLRHTEQG